MYNTLDNGRYAVLDCIGHGGSADVYAVVDEKLGIERAVKIPRERPDAAEAARLQREASVLLHLDHPGILRVFDTFVVDGRPCLVMERCQGSLEERIFRAGPLSPEAALALGERLRVALAAVHALGVLHRDVKPANVLFSGSDEPRLADFGVALSQRDPGTLTRTGAVLGTVAFMAPAVRRGEPESQATDRYGLAATVAFAVLGRLPGDVDRASVQRQLPPAVAHWIRVLLESDGAIEPAAATVAGGGRRKQVAVAVGLLCAGALFGWFVGRTDRNATQATEAKPNVPVCTDVPPLFNWQSAPGAREVVASDFLDITGDGHPDAVFVSQQDELLHVLPGGPGASVERRIDLAVGRAAVPPTLLDLDQDGHPELVLPERDAARLRLLWLGPALEVERLALFEQAGPMEHAQALDIDGDGILDLVGPIDFGRYLVWRRVPGDGTLEPHRFLLNVRDTTVRSMVGRDLLVDAGGVTTWRRLGEDGDITVVRTVPSESQLVDTPMGPVVLARNEGIFIRRDGTSCVPDDIIRFLRQGTRTGLRFADWDGDGRLDALGSRTCRGCTSELMVGVGI